MNPTDDEIDKLVEQMLAGHVVEVDDDEDPERGPPLTEAEEVDAEMRLACWQGPVKFGDDTMSLCARYPSEIYFNRPQLKFLRDAYVLAEFARLISAEEVRLVATAEQWPDGLIKLDGATHNIEIVSTHGGRKLGKEYREVQGLRFDPGEAWVRRANLIPKSLDEVIAGKVKKRYGPPCWLVVYLNINEYGIRQKETEATIASHKAAYASDFARISVLWKGKLY